MTRPDATVVLLFGGNGDLSRRKLLPALFHLFVTGMLPADWRIIGISRSEFSDDEFDAFARDAIAEFTPGEGDEDALREFCARLSYVSGEFAPGASGPLADAVAAAERELGGEPRRLCYLAVPPPAFPVITEGLAEAGLTQRATVVYEKPFGLDEPSFHALRETVDRHLRPDQVFAIDHFLGKEAVQNVLALRFANGMFEAAWNRNHIDHVQIDVPETLDVGTRAGFYEQTGALRDMVVTHLFQVLAVVAMEPPYALEPDPLIEERLKVFEMMRPLRCEDVVRGQYEGYVGTEGVAAGSQTETFVAVRVEIDNWRWSGVPFFLRTGKAMAESRQTVTLAFREPPRQMFRNVAPDRLPNDHLMLDLGEGDMHLSFLAKAPGPQLRLAPARLTFGYDEPRDSELDAYERLLLDALAGDRTLFTRADQIERTWELVADVLADPPEVRRYPRGSWGPEEAARLISPRAWCLPDRH